MYPIMTDFIDRMQKDALKKNLMAFFIRLDNFVISPDRCRPY